ncbi:MAG: TolC family protein [Planctomycetota bacterium]
MTRSTSRARPLAAVVLALPLLGVGCASLRADGLWALPPHEPPPLDAPPAPVALTAALGSACLAELGPRWLEGAGPLQLSHVLASVAEAYPLLSAARQEQVLADAKQLSALGAFDLQLRGGAAWAPEGYYEHNTADASLRQRTGLWGLEVWGGYRLGAGDFDPTWDGKRVTNHGGEVRAGASLPLLRDGEIDGARRDLLASTLDREIAASEVALRRLRFDQEAAIAYWRWVAAGRRLRVADELLELAQVRQQGIEGRVRRGDLPELEAQDNRRLVLRRRGLQVGARRELEKAVLGLSLFLRDERGQPLRAPASALPGRFPDPARPDLQGLALDLEAALRQRPDLRQLAQRLGRAGVDLRYTQNQRLPRLDFSVSASQDLDRSRPSVTKGEFELVAGFELSFPVQNRAAEGKLLASRAELERLAEQERYLRDKVEAEVRDALSALHAAWERADQARQAAELARVLAAAERRRFELGEVNVLTLNLREEAAAEAELQRIGALLEYWASTADYRRAVGAAPAPR